MLCPQLVAALWIGSMDPLGARSQFVCVETLLTWDQPEEVVDGREDAKSHQREEADQLTEANQENCPVSPFPFREDINRKIILLWVTRHQCLAFCHGIHFFPLMYYCSRALNSYLLSITLCSSVNKCIYILHKGPCILIVVSSHTHMMAWALSYVSQ